MITYLATLDVPRELVWFVARLTQPGGIPRTADDDDRCSLPRPLQLS